MTQSGNELVAMVTAMAAWTASAAAGSADWFTVGLVGLLGSAFAIGFRVISSDLPEDIIKNKSMLAFFIGLTWVSGAVAAGFTAWLVIALIPIIASEALVPMTFVLSTFAAKGLRQLAITDAGAKLVEKWIEKVSDK